ncbi:MAG: hypothetical protein GY771_08500, partial [bacterium]|nr:hypothetical protein [bacterium]
RYSRDDIAFVFVTESDFDPELERAPEWSYERIGQRDLAFTRSEISTVFDSELNEIEVGEILEFTGGWPFGVSLLRRVWDRSAPLDEVLGRSWPEVEAFFSDKLYEPLNTNLKDFLLKSSILDFVEPGIITPLFGEEAERTFDEARSLQLFSAGDRPDYFVLQPLFAKYLEDRAVRELGSEDISGLYARVAEVYRISGNAFYAVYYAVKSSITDTIDETIAALFDYVIVFGDEDFQILVDAASDDTIGKGMDLLRAVNFYRKVDYEPAKNAFGELWRSNVEDADVIFGIAVWHYAYLLSFMRETDTEFIATIESWPEGNDADSFVLMARTVDVEEKYDVDEVYEICKRAIAIAEENDNPNWLTVLYCTATSLSRSIELHSESAEYAEKSNLTSKRRPTALKHLVEISLDCGDTGKASGYLMELEILERSLPLRFRYLVNAARGYFALNGLKFEEAHNYFMHAVEQYVIVWGGMGKGEAVGDLLLAAVLLKEEIPDLFVNFGIQQDVSGLFTERHRFWRPLLLYEFLQGDDIRSKISGLLPIAEKKELAYSTGFLYLLRALTSVRNGGVENAEDDLARLETGVNEDLITRVTRKALGTDDLELCLPGDISVDKKPVATVNFLGGLTAEYDGKTLTEADWEQRRALSLFAFLAKHRDESFTTERLIANVWPEADLDKGKQSLKTALKYIRGILGDIGLTEVVGYSSKLYNLAGSAFGESDVEKLDGLTEAAEIANNEGDTEKSLRYLKEAERINRNDFLPNLYDDWADRYLHYYRILRMDTLERICNLLADLGRREDFLSYSARLIMAVGNDETTQYILEENAAKLGVDISYILNR